MINKLNEVGYFGNLMRFNGGREFRFAFISKANLKQIWARVEEIAVPQFEEVQKLQNVNFECPRNLQFLRKPAGFF